MEAGAFFLFESVATGCEKKQNDKKDTPIDIRKPLKEKHPADIRQRW